MLIVCIDGLKGFEEAIQSIFPLAEVQSCVVHQIRNSLKYVASKDQKPFMADLKPVYKATTKDLAEQNLAALADKWGKKYPIVIKSWQDNWHKLSTYFKYTEEIRRIIYTTNTFEGFHRQVRKYPKQTAIILLFGLVIELEQPIKLKTAELRKAYRIKLPDSVIACAYL